MILQEIRLLLRALFCIGISFFEEIVRVLYKYVDDIRTVGLGFDTASFQKPVSTFAKIDEGKYPAVKMAFGELATTEEALSRWHHPNRIRIVRRCDGDDRNVGNLLKITRREDYVNSHN